MFRHIALSLTALTLALSISACALYPSGPDSTDPAILFAGDMGILCAAIGVKAPAQLQNAKMATSAVKAILAGEAPSVDAIKAAFEAANVPVEYQALAAAVLNRILARVDASGVLKKDSVPFEAVKAFVDSCDAALPPLPVVQ